MTGKRIKKNSEPTIRDISDKLDFVMEIMDARFSATDKRFMALNKRIDGIDDRLVLVQGKLAKVEVTVLDMQDDLKGALAAIDTDSLKILNHEQRIRRLEKVR